MKWKDKLEWLFNQDYANITLRKNEHKTCYETVEEYIGGSSTYDYDFMSEEDRQKCIETDTMFEFRIYPSTPVGFNEFCGSSLEIVVNQMYEWMK
ncbi:unnamed protein product [marine sediment metagenome]|uniref:Uncharacterized protein n=1 Tax=marine sediment metagenome TaxID=412755 RepID=X0SG71_9ZZZZ